MALFLSVAPLKYFHRTKKKIVFLYTFNCLWAFKTGFNSWVYHCFYLNSKYFSKNLKKRYIHLTATVVPAGRFFWQLKPALCLL